MRPLSIDRRRFLLLLTPIALGAGVLAAVLSGGVAAAPPAPAPAVEGVQAVVPVPGLLVDISGAVAHPGVYRLRRGDRVAAAIAAAGGLTAAADPSRAPNLAGRLRDGQQVRVPSIKGSGGTGGAARASLNTGTAEELAAVPGFTSDLAGEVVTYREAFGPFTSTRQLLTEVGMSPPAYALAKSHVGI